MALGARYGLGRTALGGLPLGFLCATSRRTPAPTQSGTEIAAVKNMRSRIREKHEEKVHLTR